MRALPLLFLLAACGAGAPEDARLRERRVALGLEDGALRFDRAMAAMQAGSFEPLLGRVGSRRLPLDPDVLDAALRIENLLVRADPATAEPRAADPEHFDALLGEAREGAGALARAAAAGSHDDALAEASRLLTTCLSCHRHYRTPR